MTVELPVTGVRELTSSTWGAGVSVTTVVTSMLVAGVVISASGSEDDSRSLKEGVRPVESVSSLSVSELTPLISLVSSTLGLLWFKFLFHPCCKKYK